MSYEKDLDYLSRELRNAQNIYDEAEKDERESDAEMWMNRVTHLEFQIEVFEKAAKADEYEAKAKAWDRTQDLLEDCTHQTPGDDYEVDWHEFEIKIDEVISDYESGELE